MQETPGRAKTPQPEKRPQRLYYLPGLMKARKRRKLTQAGLAKKAGVARETVVMLEWMHNAARTDTVNKLLAALKAPPEELLGNSKHKRKQFKRDDLLHTYREEEGESET